MNRLYFDYCATTPVHESALQVMLSTLQHGYGNPSSLHWAGQEARRLLETARGQVAQAIGAQPEEIVFTSGATEADNLALLGIMRRFPTGHLITTRIEHHAILHAAAALESGGYSVTYLPVDQFGVVNPECVRQALRPDTRLISVMWVNNEVGSIQPVEEIAALARQHGCLFHTDAVQAAGLLDVNVASLGADLLSLSAHKIYGPKGIGALYVRRGLEVAPLAYGGPQESQRRPGTENLPGITGFGAALQQVCEHKASKRQRLSELRTYFIEQLFKRLPDLEINGSPQACAPHIVSASFPGAEAEMMLFRLNSLGIAVSMGSACNAESIEPSHVLMAMGLSRARAESTLRISFGFPTTRAEVDALLAALPPVAASCRLPELESD